MTDILSVLSSKGIPTNDVSGQFTDRVRGSNLVVAAQQSKKAYYWTGNAVETIDDTPSALWSISATNYGAVSLQIKIYNTIDASPTSIAKHAVIVPANATTNFAFEGCVFDTGLQMSVTTDYGLTASTAPVSDIMTVLVTHGETH